METERITTVTRQGITYTVVDPWIEFEEMDSRDKRHPLGRTRTVRADRIDSVSDTYKRGGCTITVNGAYFHVTMDSEELLPLLREIETAGVSA